MSVQYDQYLENHKANVRKAYEWIKKNVPEILTNPTGEYDYEWQICFGHDDSKTDLDEYRAYDAYFYGGNRSYGVVNDFKKAFLRHIRKNPHHWQHWVLIHDEPNEPMEAVDMPYNYIMEMICDWWSFSWAKGDLYEIFKWYDEHKNYMILDDYTREMIKRILGAIKDELDSQKERK